MICSKAQVKNMNDQQTFLNNNILQRNGWLDIQQRWAPIRFCQKRFSVVAPAVGRASRASDRKVTGLPIWFPN